MYTQLLLFTHFPFGVYIVRPNGSFNYCKRTSREFLFSKITNIIFVDIERSKIRNTLHYAYRRPYSMRNSGFGIWLSDCVSAPSAENVYVLYCVRAQRHRGASVFYNVVHIWIPAPWIYICFYYQLTASFIVAYSIHCLCE